MPNHTRLLVVLLGMAPLIAAQAATETESQAPAAAADKAACKAETARNGAGQATGDAVCAIKHLFQRRIRRQPEKEPVEMTVGSPPMQSEDSDTPGNGNWEGNVAFGGEFAGGAHEIEFPILDINYGVGDQVQLTYGVPYVSLREDDGTGHLQSAHGVGDSEFGLKYRFYDNEDRGVSMALYPQVRVRTPGANGEVSNGGTAYALPLILVTEFEHFSLTANVGMEFADGEHSTFASFGAGRRLTDRLAVMAELAGRNLDNDGRHVLVNVGVRQKLSDAHSISASIGRDVDVGAGEDRLTYAMINYQMLLGE